MRHLQSDVRANLERVASSTETRRNINVSTRPNISKLSTGQIVETN
jgi:hypothetical protein